MTLFILMVSAAIAADDTSNGSIAGRPAISAEDVCGWKYDLEALSGRQQRLLAERYPECVRAQAALVAASGRIEVEKLEASGRVDIAFAATILDRNMHAEGDEIAVGNAAAISALTDDEGGGLNFGLGTGMPYGASPFQAVQNAGFGWQAVQAHQNAAPVVTNAGVVPPTAVPAAVMMTEAQKAEKALAAVAAAVEDAQ